ncbi:MAG: alanine dehydrogenase [Acidobacteriota bacterium]
MNIGVPRERRAEEYRVGLTPAAVDMLAAGGHVCWIEKDAGRGAGFPDSDYEKAGAKIVYSGEEVYGRADLIVKVSKPTAAEIGWLKEGAVLMGFLHLAAGHRDRVDSLLANKVTAIAYETIQSDDGTLPVLVPLSHLGGMMLPQVAGSLLQNDHGGKGILLSGLPGVPPAEVAILGAGTFGTAAARAFLGIGSSVYMLDQDLGRLQDLEEKLGIGRHLVLMVAHAANIRKVATFADVLVGAIHIPGVKSPVVVTRDMVRSMKPRSVIMDIAIDQGGCVETSRPTTHRDPTFVAENVTHYCVPNLTSVVARSASYALGHAAWPFVSAVATQGLETALANLASLRRGVATHQGHVVDARLASHLGLPEVTL